MQHAKVQNVVSVQETHYQATLTYHPASYYGEGCDNQSDIGAASLVIVVTLTANREYQQTL